MIEKVIKRDGRIVEFEKEKITQAILKAMQATNNINKRTASRIANEISNLNYQTIEIETIQDIVEEKLMASSYKDVAKAYVLYRNERSAIRSKNTKLMQTIEQKIMATNVQNQNANVDELSFGGRMGEARNELMKDYAINYLLSDMAKENHLNNMIYIHDLDHYAIGDHNCLTIPFDKLLAEGFNTRQTDVRPANSVNTAFQLIAVIFQLQSLQQFGGVSASHIDWTMVPYVRKSFYKHYKNGLKYIVGREIDYSLYDTLSIEDPDYKACSEQVYNYAMDMTVKEINQAVEGMYHNLNTLQSRSGNQLN